MEKEQILSLMDLAIKAALEAGKEILTVYHAEDFDVSLKNDNSPLTKADKKAHQAISSILEPTNIPILSEEGKLQPYEERKHWNQLWLVDPLDGTKEFIKRNGEFTVNIALVIGNTPVMGVIYVPVTRELYAGATAIGSFKVVAEENATITTNILVAEKNKIPLPIVKEIPVIVGSRSHMSPETEEVFEKIKKKYGFIDIISKGSSLKLCMIAEGLADFYPRFAPTMEWDIAAGHAIVCSAGCIITQQDNISPLSFNKENLLNPWFIARKKYFDVF